MIMTMLEASVPEERVPELVAAYQLGITELEPGIVQTWLVQSATDPALWRIQTLWRDREALQAMRATGMTPKGSSSSAQQEPSPRSPCGTWPHTQRPEPTS